MAASVSVSGSEEETVSRLSRRSDVADVTSNQA